MDLAGLMGADHVLYGDDDVQSKIMNLTGGTGADVVLEMAGVQAAVTNGLAVVRKGGRFCAFGLPPKEVIIDISNDVIFKGITIYGINGRLMFDTWIKSRQLLSSGKLDIEPVITHYFPLAEFEKAFELILTEPRVTGKIALYPDPSIMPVKP